VFKFSNNKNSDKKKGDDIAQLMMGDFMSNQRNKEEEVTYQDFKAISEESYNGSAGA